MPIQPPVLAALPYQPTAGSIALLEIRLVSSVVTSVPVTTSAVTAIGATTLTVTALTGAIPAGTVLHFASQDVTLTAAAASAATSLVVLPLTLALPASSSSYDGYIVQPVQGAVNLAITPTDVVYAAYATSGLNVWDYAVKVASAAKLDFRCAAPDTDPSVAPFVVAGLQSGSAALIAFRRRRSSGAWYSGYSTIGVSFTDPERGISETMFNGTVTGPLIATLV